MYKLGLEKAEEPQIKLPTFTGSWRKQGSFRKTFLFSPWGLKVGQDLATEQQQPIEKFSLSHQHITLPVTGDECLSSEMGS